MRIVPVDAKFIPKAVKNWVSSPKTADFVENTIFAVGVETGLKMVGRPTFIMMDKEADSPEKKKYAAVKEMLYQGICLTLYLSCMQPIKHFLYGGISKLMRKNPENAAKLDLYDTHNDKMHDIDVKLKADLKNVKDKLAREKIRDEAMSKIISMKEEIRTNKNLHLGKGVKEFSAIIGSILMLTVIAPQISHLIIHPIMKARSE